MEALWNLEEKWKLTTQEALLLFVCAASAVIVVCAASAVIGVCAATVLKKKARKKRMADQDPVVDGPVHAKWCEPSCNWVSAKRVPMGSVMWSGANRWGRDALVWGRGHHAWLGMV